MTAILLMTVVAVAVLSLTSLTAAQFKRTRREVSGGQLRQVLLAATADISARLSTGATMKPNDEIVLALPAQLADVKLTTRVDSADVTRVVATMHARNDVMQVGQRVTFAKQDGKWKLSGVEWR
ncbi:MAG: hypothetical protein ACHRHE_01020 [Tepidisphaerales bacterium]